MEAVLILSEKYYFVRSIDVSHFLGVTKATVSSTTKNLEKDGLLNKSEEGNLSLTEAGRRIAEEVYEKHCFFREWLKSAGVDPATADREACMLEHAISNETFLLLREALKKKEPADEQNAVGDTSD